ncbi:thioredoxin [Pseudoglutamicibacter cumminsii]|uniref:Thioredoxin n=1 Tax=Pseudoglutamicibacter cumminsii TaxID=156979 RepID=A0ABX5L5C8_9MICC|nr:thioredoxin [Pseudoglutamicibacter cumminsii]PWI27519.1 thioredoxin [Pseudoglutamicibacter cumminsii]
MATFDLTADKFQETVQAEGITAVDFWAEWCGPCKQFAPIYEAVSEKHQDVRFAKVDTEAEQGLASAAQITSIPTLMVFRDGLLVFRQAGALPASALEDVLEQVKALDMDDVRRQIAEAEAQEDSAQ